MPPATPTSRDQPGPLLALVWGAHGFEHSTISPSDTPAIIVSSAGTRAARGPETEIIHLKGVLADREGQAELIIHSLPGLVSLKPASPELRLLYPGLKEKARVSVPKVTPQILLDKFGDDAGQINLVLDTPGSELEQLELLERAGILNRISLIRLRCLAARGFAGSADHSELINWLEDRNFALRPLGEPISTNDKDWPILEFVFDLRALKIQALEGELGEKNRILASRDAELKTAQDAYARVESELRAARDSVAALTEKCAQVQTQADWRRSRIDELEAEQKKNEKLAERLAQTEANAAAAERRLNLSRDQLRRAEGQIELIKDLLLQANSNE